MEAHPDKSASRNFAAFAVAASLLCGMMGLGAGWRLGVQSVAPDLVSTAGAPTAEQEQAETAVTDLQREKEALQKRVAKLESDLKRKSTEVPPEAAVHISVAEREREELRNRIRSLEDELEAKDTEIRDLQTRLDQARSAAGSSGP